MGLLGNVARPLRRASTRLHPPGTPAFRLWPGTRDLGACGEHLVDLGAVWGAVIRFRLLSRGFRVGLRGGPVLVDQPVHCAAALEPDDLPWIAGN